MWNVSHQRHVTKGFRKGRFIEQYPDFPLKGRERTIQTKRRIERKRQRGRPEKRRNKTEMIPMLT